MRFQTTLTMFKPLTRLVPIHIEHPRRRALTPPLHLTLRRSSRGGKNYMKINFFLINFVNFPLSHQTTGPGVSCRVR